MMETYPFKPGDWIADPGENVGHVKSVYGDSAGGVLLDIVRYDRQGNKLGRVSPACGGPRTFEPACPAGEWRRIEEPDFPLTLQWVPEGDRVVMKYWAGKALPPLQWKPRARAGRYALRSDDRLKQALREIADGHNDARQLAKDVLHRS